MEDEADAVAPDLRDLALGEVAQLDVADPRLAGGQVDGPDLGVALAVDPGRSHGPRRDAGRPVRALAVLLGVPRVQLDRHGS
jgi:hypothetical protein